MTRLLEQAVAAAQSLPAAMQDEIARIVLQLADIEQADIVLTAPERAALSASLAEAQRGVFANDDEVKAVWEKHGL